MNKETFCENYWAFVLDTTEFVFRAMQIDKIHDYRKGPPIEEAEIYQGILFKEDGSYIEHRCGGSNNLHW